MRQFVFITGVSSGIGYETTKLLIRKGYHILGSVRKESDAQRLRDTFGDAFHALIFDARDDQAISRAAEKASSIVGSDSLVAIVNNAGIAVNGPLLHVDIDEVSKQLDVNVLGPLRVTQAFFGLLQAGKNTGTHKRIIQVGSISGLMASPFVGPYCMSKFALEAMTDSLRRECAIYPDVDVVILEPASFDTPIWDKALDDNDDYAHTDYAEMLRNKDKFIAKQRDLALPTPMLAEEIYKLIRNKKVPTRKMIARPKWLYVLLVKWLPDRWVDKLVLRPFLTK